MRVNPAEDNMHTHADLTDEQRAELDERIRNRDANKARRELRKAEKLGANAAAEANFRSRNAALAKRCR